MPNEYELQLEQKLEEASDRGLSNNTALMEYSINEARRLAEEAGLDVSKRIAQIERIGYQSGAMLKLAHAKQLIVDGKPDVARIALHLVQRYAGLAEDEDTFFEAEEIMKGLGNKLGV